MMVIGIISATVIFTAASLADLFEYRFYPFRRKFSGSCPSLAARTNTADQHHPRGQDVRQAKADKGGNQRRNWPPESWRVLIASGAGRGHNGSWEHPGDNLSRGDIDDACQRGTAWLPAVRCVSGFHHAGADGGRLNANERPLGKSRILLTMA